MSDERLRQRLRPAAEVLAREVDGEMILLDLAGGQYYALDEVGTTMWLHLTAEESVAAARDRLLEDFDVEAERLEADLLELVDQLIESGLLEAVDPADRPSPT